MDKGDIEEFKIRSGEILVGIERLQREIKKYKTGAESFQTASELMEEMVKKEGKMLEMIEDYVMGLYKMDAEGIVDEMTGVVASVKKADRNIEDNTNRLIKLQRELEAAIDRVEELEVKYERALDQAKKG